MIAPPKCQAWRRLRRSTAWIRAYVSRILGLAMLAPDLAEAAVKGDEPDGLSLRRLATVLPMPWDEQRASWAEQRITQQK